MVRYERVLTWTLNGTQPEACADTLRWARWFSSPAGFKARRIDETDLGQIRVSTVFLGVDHNFSLNGAPILFETMAFGPVTVVGGNSLFAEMEYHPEVGPMARYATWGEAKAGHARIVAECKQLLEKNDTAIADVIARVKQNVGKE